MPFEVYADGIDLVVFEEFGAGRAALHLQDEVARNELLRDEAYRRWFRARLREEVRAAGLAPRLRRRGDRRVPRRRRRRQDRSGRSPTSAASTSSTPSSISSSSTARSCAGTRRSPTHRPEMLDELAQQPGVQIGFSDAGAHLRNMAFYNFAIRLLTPRPRCERAGEPFMPLEQAVHRLTGELGRLLRHRRRPPAARRPRRLAVIDPAGLDASTEQYHEAPMPEFGGLRRMVNRNDRAVTATLVGGRSCTARGVRRRLRTRDWRSGACCVPARSSAVWSPAQAARRAGAVTATAPARRTQLQRREQTIGRIVDATIDALCELGYARTSVTEIGARAGVSQGGIFRHFDTRLDIVVAAAAEVPRGS